MDKINELILQKVSQDLQMRFPEDFISVTKVETSKDLSFAKIWISSIKNIDSVAEEVSKEAGEIRKGLAGSVELRKVPYLRFVADHTSEKAEYIEELIKKAKDES